MGKNHSYGLKEISTTLSKPYRESVFSGQINWGVNIYWAKCFHLKIAALCSKWLNKLRIHFIPNIIQELAQMSRGLICADPVENKYLDIHWKELVDNKVLLQDLKWFGDRLSDLISKSSYLHSKTSRVFWQRSWGASAPVYASYWCFWSYRIRDSWR